MQIDQGEMYDHLGIPFPYWWGGHGKLANNGAEFESFISVISSYGSISGPAGNPYKQLTVSKENGGLKLLVTTEQHFFCNYRQNFGQPIVWNVATPIGNQCPAGNNQWAFIGSSLGQDQPSSAHWLIPDCKELPND